MPAPGKAHAVLYYSKDGHTAALARRIAVTLNADLFQITTARYSTGWPGNLRAGYDSLRGVLPPIDPVGNLSGYDSLSLGAPIWTSYPATPLRAYFAQKPELPAALGLFLSGSNHSPPEKAFGMASGLCDRHFDATLSVANTLDDTAAEARIAPYCAALTTAARP